MSTSHEPPSLGRSATSAAETAPNDPTLLRLHAALKALDAAVHDAVRCLDVALGRPPRATPPDNLPFRELGRLKLHLEAATSSVPEPQDRNLSSMALDWSDEQDAATVGETGSQDAAPEDTHPGDTAATG